MFLLTLTLKTKATTNYAHNNYVLKSRRPTLIFVVAKPIRKYALDVFTFIEINSFLGYTGLRLL